MANLRLKKHILDVVEAQIRDNEPPITREVYEKLLDAGYSAKEAKENIGSVVVAEIYDVLKENKCYDEKKYEEAMREMLNQCIDYEYTHTKMTEWNEWDKLVKCGYAALEKRDEAKMVSSWWEAWLLFKEIIKTAEMKMSISAVMESQDYKYPVDAWLQDMEMEFGNAFEHDKRMEFCCEVLEMFDWTYDDGDNFRCAIGEVFYNKGNIEDGKRWFEELLKKEPHNCNVLCAYSWCVQKNEGLEKAYELIQKEIKNKVCSIENYALFEHAKFLTQQLGMENDLVKIEEQLDVFRESMKKLDYYDDFKFSVQQPIVKATKIYPNDPCPCRSGKKYKKCCGKK